METVQKGEHPEFSKAIHQLAEEFFTTYHLEAFGQFTAWKLTGKLPYRAGELG
jgi:hypothetical protein